MKWSAVAAALVMAAAPLAAQQPQATSDSGQGAGRTVSLRGCVRAGVDKDTVLMTDVVEAAGAGRSAMPTEAHGRKVLFLLDRDEPLKAHVGHMVEVTGTQGPIEESEVELKAGRQKSGGLVAEFEGPGGDVKASNDVVGPALGTSGRAVAEKNDIQTFLIKVKVNTVRPVDGSCN
jgi:hypothetical protein